MKACKSCGIGLEIPGTYSLAMAKSRKSRCLPCESNHAKQYNEAYRSKNREQAKAATKTWRINNPEKYKAKLEAERVKRAKKNDP